MMTQDNTILWPIAFASESLSSMEWGYSSIELEALGTLHSLKKFHHYCIARDVSVITVHKHLVVMIKKYVATHHSSYNALCWPINQYKNMCNTQTRTLPIHRRLVIETEPCGK